MGRMLKAVTTGRQKTPLKEMVFGVPGVGKTTFAAEAPAPIFLGEDGTKRLDVARFPVARSWKDLHDAIAELTREKHEWKTLCLDTVDHASALAEAAVCAREERSSLGEIPFGRGPGYVVDLWREFLRALDELQAKTGMNLLLLAHAQVKAFKNPTGDDYDRYVLRVNDQVAALLVGWVESQLFASYDVTVKKGQKKDLKGKAVEVERWLYTTKIPAADAKNRHDLPARIPLSFAEFARLIERGDSERAASLRETAQELLEQVQDEARRTRAGEALRAAGDDLTKLRSVVARLNATIAEQENDDNAAAVDRGAGSSPVPDVSAAAAPYPDGAGGGSTEGSVSTQAARSPSPPPARSSSSFSEGVGVHGPAVAIASSPPSARAPEPPKEVQAVTNKLNSPNGGEGAGAVPRLNMAAPAPDPNAPVTLGEILRWVGESNVARAQAALEVLQDPKKHETPSRVPSQIASLIEARGTVLPGTLEKWWTGAGGTFETAYRTEQGKRKPVRAFAPMTGLQFVQFWFAGVRDGIPPIAEADMFAQVPAGSNGGAP